MSEKKITESEVVKSLAALKALAVGESVEKGLKGSGPVVADSGSASDVGAATQLHQGKGDSFASVKTHAGTTTGTASFDGEYSPNGTDVNYGAVAKSILDLVAAGKLTSEAASEMFKAMNGKKVEAKPFEGKETPEEEEAEKKEMKKEETKKSLADHAQDDLADDLEVSEFLTNFVTSISKALTDAEDRIVTKVVNHIAASNVKQDAFNKSLAGAVASLGEGLVATSGRIDSVEKQPAAAPKSQMLAKSFGGEENLSKSDILSTMHDLVVKGDLNPHTVVLFETTGQIDQRLMNKIISHRSGK